jgi:hypothetical protein
VKVVDSHEVHSILHVSILKETTDICSAQAEALANSN